MLELDLVSGWLVATHTYLYYFIISLLTQTVQRSISAYI